MTNPEDRTNPFCYEMKTESAFAEGIEPVWWNLLGHWLSNPGWYGPAEYFVAISKRIHEGIYSLNVNMYIRIVYYVEKCINMWIMYKLVHRVHASLLECVIHHIYLWSFFFYDFKLLMSRFGWLQPGHFIEYAHIDWGIPHKTLNVIRWKSATELLWREPIHWSSSQTTSIVAFSYICW